ncbi:UPF0104 family protein [Candidatus Woesearchaeota archaeon]|nr:MAG: UPF0104 family protein [Candidatus Woesearchaeota archaeon]
MEEFGESPRRSAFKMKRSTQLALAFLIGFVLIIIVYRNIGLLNLVKTLAATSLRLFLLYVLIIITLLNLLNFRWWLILRSQGHTIPFFKMLSYRMAGYAVSYVTPSAHIGGEPVRAYLLKREKIPFSTAFSSVLIDRSVDLTTNAFFSVLGCVIVIINFVLTPNTILLAITLTAIFVLFIFLFYYNVLRGKGFFIPLFRFLKLNKLFGRNEKKLEQIESNLIKFFRHKKKEFLTTFLLSLIIWAVMFLEYKFALLMLGFNVSWLQVFLIIAGVGIAYIIPIPAALGILEAAQVSLFTILNLGGAIGLALSLIVRLKDTIFTIIGFAILFFFGVRRYP